VALSLGGDRRRRVLCVVGTRPNFMKMAPVIAELRRRREEFEVAVAHTGQHYDSEMSSVFLDQLGIPEPDFELGVGSGSHAQQTARVMERMEPVLSQWAPDLVLVPGDVNSTLAAALVAAKLEIPVGHVEAGLRSFDRTMPEEINRVLTDQLSELLFVHSPEAVDHLAAEGIGAERVHYVGNTMIDTLVTLRERIDATPAPAALGLRAGEFLLVTLHRPALVDGPDLVETVAALDAVAESLAVVFPAHPRTRRAMQALGLAPSSPAFRLIEPLGYLQFMSLLAAAAGVLTDSGGIQEETTFMGVPCFTLRDNTERPITLSAGTNTLLGRDPGRIAEIPAMIAATASRPAPPPPPLWDGLAARRLADAILHGAAVAC
jgi:UDP-N-acetylglucosamine 2-epimerase (non-hydrolysing)